MLILTLFNTVLSKQLFSGTLLSTSEVPRVFNFFYQFHLRIPSCMKRVASPGSMHDTGCLELVHWDDPEGWYGEGGARREEGSGWGTHVHLWRIHFDIWQNQYNIVKLKKR